jgi:hypothetical protein
MVALLLPTIALGQTTKPSQVEEKLNTRIDDLNLAGLTIREACVRIADKTRLNILPDWPNLENMSLDLNRKLRGRLSDVTAREALQLALTDAGLDAPAQWEIDGNILRITRPPIVITRVYPVGRIVDMANQRRPPSTQPADEQYFAGADELIKTLTTTIDPDSWRDAGGTVGAASALGRQLIITQSIAAHEKIEKLLRTLDQAAKDEAAHAK